MKKLAVKIGSLFGVLASAAGVVTIFFPDALNLQKNKIKTFDVEIDSRADVDTLEAFLMANPNKLVQLTVSVCGSRDRSQALPRVERSNDSLRVLHDDCDPSGESMCTGDTYYFASLDDDKANVWGWDKFGVCKNGNDDGVLGVSGYFMVPAGPGFGQGNSEWLLEPIAAKDVALKDY
jgi:hypothetical protein